MLRYGIIGAGAIARRGHIPALRKIRDVEIVAIVDINEETARSVAREFKIEKYYTDYRDILDEDIDIVVISTPPQTHKEIAVDFAKAKKHLVIEKPLTLNVADALEILKTVRKKGIKATMVQNYRYFSAVRKAKSLIKAGRIGEVIDISGTAQTHFPTGWTKGRWLYHEGAVLYDYFPHLVDLSLWLLDFPEIDSIYATGGDFLEHSDFVNYANIVITFKNKKFIYNLKTSWLVGTLLFNMQIWGTGGWITLDVRSDHIKDWHGIITPIEETLDALFKLLRVGWNVLNKSFFISPLMNLKYLHQDFIRSIIKNKPEPIPLQEGLKTIIILEGALKSIKEKRIIFHDEIT